MKNRSLPVLLLFLVLAHTSCKAQQNKQQLNLDFETIKGKMPVGWETFGEPNYLFYPDSTQAKSGKYAATIQSQKDHGAFKAWSYTLPANYPGKKITLSGYLKTENVTGGFAGLWMRIDPQIAFDNMQRRGISGTHDWTKYEITLNMNPEKTTQIVVGGLLVGEGKIWMDDLEVTVDGTPVQQLKPFEKELLPADKDREFDNGSKIETITLQKNNIATLKALGLIWGFLKYEHPSVARGNYNWDYELFRVLPSLLNTHNRQERDAMLVKWIQGLGSFTTNKNNQEAQTDNIKVPADLEWISNGQFSRELTDILLSVKNSPKPENNYYLGFLPTQNANFKNERPYTTPSFPDAGFRLLALYRYWNIIQYYFPYKQLIGEDWKNVLEAFIPKILNTKNETEYILALLELIASVHDTHANIWGNNPVLNKYRGTRYAPMEVTFIQDQPVVTGYLNDTLGKATGLIKGDVITEINKLPFKKIIQEQLPYRPASNYPTQLRDIAQDLLRTNDSTIQINYVRGEQTKSLVLKTYAARELNLYRKYQIKDTCFRIIDNDIAYINNGSLKKAYLPKLWEAIRETKGLIIDNRNYPSDFVLYDLGAYLMPKPIPFVKFTAGSLQNPGSFRFGSTLNIGANKKDFYKGKIIILVNETSQSSSEFHAMAYRAHPNAMVLGSTTAGADGNVSQFFLPGGISTMISGIGVYYPDGRETQRVGIVPDIEIKPTISGVKNNRDEVLEKAIELIRK